MPSTWADYGVDANGDGVADPYNPEDAIFAAARYLSAAGMPADTYGAIFAYNHADWYVSEVLANAGCYAGEVGDPAFPPPASARRSRSCAAARRRPGRSEIPADYLSAFEDAAARYELGKRGVWALAAIARLESNFGRGMDEKQLRQRRAARPRPAASGTHYAVDGDEDGHVSHADIADSAATLARRSGRAAPSSAGIFTHNQAEWYVQEVLQQAEQIEGGCKVSYVDWRVGAARHRLGDRRRPTRCSSPAAWPARPRGAPPAVKAAIAAANSIATTPYVWGGGHGSCYSYGYDCSGAVSFALYGAGLLDTPLTSGALESYGEPGPGRWITIYASATHTYAVIAGLRWDTVGDAPGTGPRWHAEPPYPRRLRRPAPDRVLSVRGSGTVVGEPLDLKEREMPTYLMLTNLTAEGVRTLKNNPGRVAEVNKEVEQIGAKVVAQYATLGQYDFVTVIEAPDEKTMAKVSVELGSRGTMTSQTLTAMSADDLAGSL